MDIEQVRELLNEKKKDRKFLWILVGVALAAAVILAILYLLKRKEEAEDWDDDDWDDDDWDDEDEEWEDDEDFDDVEIVEVIEEVIEDESAAEEAAAEEPVVETEAPAAEETETVEE
ncbi:MAG: hypothetical protein IJ315_04125 [Firmicutes bacterium]|nr:hypothetical protein [Bacillota bacterium]